MVWYTNVLLKEKFPNLYELACNKKGGVSEIRWDRGAWSIKFRRNLTEYLIVQWEELLSTIDLHTITHQLDRRRWLLSSHDTFKAKSCHNELSGNVITAFYAFIWSLSVPFKVKKFG